MLSPHHSNSDRDQSGENSNKDDGISVCKQCYVPILEILTETNHVLIATKMMALVCKQCYLPILEIRTETNQVTIATKMMALV